MSKRQEVINDVVAAVCIVEGVIPDLARNEHEVERICGVRVPNDRQWNAQAAIDAFGADFDATEQ